VECREDLLKLRTASFAAAQLKSRRGRRGTGKNVRGKQNTILPVANWAWRSNKYLFVGKHKH
jgi:hypothetical protein